MMTMLKTLLNRGSSTVSKGKYYEGKACDYLKKQGLKEFQFNFHSRYGEIDLIATDKDTLVFIEVRYRKNRDHGGALATVNIHKQKKIIKTAQHFLQKKGLNNKIPCRFDVIGITGKVTDSAYSMESIDNLEFQWIKNAF